MVVSEAVNFYRFHLFLILQYMQRYNWIAHRIDAHVFIQLNFLVEKSSQVGKHSSRDQEVGEANMNM